MDGSKSLIVDRTHLALLSGRLVLLTNPQHHFALRSGCNTANASGGNACEVLGLNLAKNALRKSDAVNLKLEVVLPEIMFQNVI